MLLQKTKSIFSIRWQFFASDDRIKAVRQMIMAPTLELRQTALDRLLPYQRSDFEGIFRAMDGMYYHCVFMYMRYQ
jgi:phosphoenolpyruvate synthase/pyruvate phosphate dikinase